MALSILYIDENEDTKATEFYLKNYECYLRKECISVTSLSVEQSVDCFSEKYFNDYDLILFHGIFPDGFLQNLHDSIKTPPNTCFRNIR